MNRKVFRSAIIILSCLMAAPLFGQGWSWPDRAENLQALPEETTAKELEEIMKSFTSALGVRCHHCHVGEEGMPLSEFDFASDEKENKKIARTMIEMVRTINVEFIETLGRDDPIDVRCVTCHHGKAEPERIEKILLDQYQEGGISALRQEYLQLRARYYGSFTYDFSENMLIEVVQELPSGAESDAIEILELNAQMYPQSFRTWHFLGELHLLKKQKEEAIDAFRKSLEINPNNPVAKKRLGELGAD